jgi:hypothetical protein
MKTGMFYYDAASVGCNPLWDCTLFRSGRALVAHQVVTVAGHSSQHCGVSRFAAVGQEPPNRQIVEPSRSNPTWRVPTCFEQQLEYMPRSAVYVARYADIRSSHSTDELYG